MQTKNLIQSQANVIKITSFKVGDVFKFMEEGYSSVDTFFGVITDLYDTGEKSFIETIMYKKNYNEVTASTKIFKGGDDIAMFPATQAEVNQYLDSALNSLASNISKKKEELEKEENAYEKALAFKSGEMSKKLTEMSYTQQTQIEYNGQKEEKES